MFYRGLKTRGVAEEDLYLTKTSSSANQFKLTHFEDDIYSSRRMRGIIMQVFRLIVAFSLQTDVSGRVVLTKGKRLKIKTSSYSRQS